MEVLIVEGTAREGRKSIKAARKAREEFKSAGHKARIFDVKNREIPMLETRRYTDPGETPEDVEEFGRMVENCDCLIIVAPEYNHSYPGALKNLLDHLYPEYDDLPFAYITVSAGGFGGVHALEDLESLTVTLGGLPGPSLPVSNVGEVFDENGEMIDEDYQERFKDFVRKVEEHVEKFGNI